MASKKTSGSGRGRRIAAAGEKYIDLNRRINAMQRAGALGRSSFSQPAFEKLLQERRQLVMKSPSLKVARSGLDAADKRARDFASPSWARSMAVSTNAGSLWGVSQGVNMRERSRKRG